jgi:hypothetical protein
MMSSVMRDLYWNTVHELRFGNVRIVRVSRGEEWFSVRDIGDDENETIFSSLTEAIQFAREQEAAVVLCKACGSQRYDDPKCDCHETSLKEDDGVKMTSKEDDRVKMRIAHIPWIEKTKQFGSHFFGFRWVKHTDGRFSFLFYLFNRTYILWG